MWQVGMLFSLSQIAYDVLVSKHRGDTRCKSKCKEQFAIKVSYGTVILLSKLLELYGSSPN